VLLQQHGVHPCGDRRMGIEEREPGLDLILGEDRRVRCRRLHTRQYTRDAVKALVKTVRTSKSEAARVCAANALLDRGYGRPPAQVDISTRSRVDVVYRSEAELRRAPIDRGLPEAMLPPRLAPSDSFTEGNDD